MTARVVVRSPVLVLLFWTPWKVQSAAGAHRQLGRFLALFPLLSASWMDLPGPLRRRHGCVLQDDFLWTPALGRSTPAHQWCLVQTMRCFCAAARYTHGEHARGTQWPNLGNGPRTPLGVAYVAVVAELQSVSGGPLRLFAEM